MTPVKPSFLISNTRIENGTGKNTNAGGNYFGKKLDRLTSFIPDFFSEKMTLIAESVRRLPTAILFIIQTTILEEEEERVNNLTTKFLSM